MVADKPTPRKGENVSDVEDYEQFARKQVAARVESAEGAASGKLAQILHRLSTGKSVTRQDATELRTAGYRVMEAATAVDELAQLEDSDEEGQDG